ncbi:hypothetical protein BJ878DRAFT_544435 [Calycina marina]|uniref:WD40 repeat protein n=1 Tax=Calycina marina TaxID=1763456 RepID=A0A9P7YYP3_9HELO|nr:hypothetical protein BJ878DRAFT_544435 [Calycina marina]
MAAVASSSTLFMSLGNIWRLLSLRHDVDDIILELLGRFSLEKIYAEADKQQYQHLLQTLLAQLNAILHNQRLTLPSENLQVGWYLGFLVSWEVTLRSVEFVLQTLLEGKELLWEAQSLRDRSIGQFLLSALRLLTLHPKAPMKQTAKDRRERFARVHSLLERIFDGYPGPVSFSMLVCREITNALKTEPNALQLPQRLRYELPNLAQELYPLADCLSSQYVSTIVPLDGFIGGIDWLSQFLALRDVSIFVIGASVQYTVNRENKDVRLQSSSARTRNAVLHALENLKIPPHLSKVDLISSFSETFRIILPDTPSSIRSADSLSDESEMDAIDLLCARLAERQIVHRVSDRELMHGISEINNNIALLDDPSGQLRATRPKIYVLNCGSCHFAGDSQLRFSESVRIPDGGNGDDIKLPPKSKCLHCGESISMVREVIWMRRIWEILKPLESNNADTINVERHLTHFRLAAPKARGTMFVSTDYSISNSGIRSTEIEQTSPYQHDRSAVMGSISEDQSRSVIQSNMTPASPGFGPRLETPRTEFSSDNLTSSNGWTHYDHLKTTSDLQISADAVSETPYSPDSVVGKHIAQQSRTDRSNGKVTLDPVPILKTRTLPVLSQPDKVKSSWFTRSLTRSKRELANKQSGDNSSLSSTSLESQRLDEISLKSLMTVPKSSSRGSKCGKNVNVNLSQNSQNAIFWTQLSIHILDIGLSPPTVVRAVSTESACVLAALTKEHLAYIVGTRDQKLTLRIVDLTKPSLPVVDHRMAASPWCKSISICPTGNYVAVGFENSLIRFFGTTNPKHSKDEKLHHHHAECKECPSVDTLSFSNDGQFLLAGTRTTTGTIQTYVSRSPFLTPAFQELISCRYRVPVHESEDNGITSTVYRPGGGLGTEENLVCLTTWTQSGIPMLVQPDDNRRREIKSASSSRQGTLGSRIQCALFSPSGRELAIVNERGHLYQASSLNSSPLEIRRIAISKELTAKSEAFAMSYMTVSDEECIFLAWVDSSKSMGYIKKIPMRFDVSSPTVTADTGSYDPTMQENSAVQPTPDVRPSIVSQASVHASRAELEGDQPAHELTANGESGIGSPTNTIDNLMADIKGSLFQ